MILVAVVVVLVVVAVCSSGSSGRSGLSSDWLGGLYCRAGVTCHLCRALTHRLLHLRLRDLRDAELE